MTNAVENCTHSSKTVLVAIPTLLIGGTEVQTLCLVKALIALNYRVVVVCFFEWNEAMLHNYLAAGATVELFSLESANQTHSSLKYKRPNLFAQSIFLFSHLKKNVATYQPQIAHVQYSTPGALPILILRMLGVSNVLGTIHQLGNSYGKLSHLLLRFSASLCSSFTAISHQALSSWFPNGAPANVQVIYNTIDPTKINRSGNEVKVNLLKKSLGIGNKRVVGVVSRLSFVKGIDLLLDCFCLINKSIQNSVLFVVGKGEEEQRLRQKANQSGISDHVLFIGEATPEEAFNYMNLFDLCLVTSRQEGFGLTVLEAITCSIPVVAFEVGGIPEIIQDGVSGRLIPDFDVEEMANVSISILNNEEKRLHLAKGGLIRSKDFNFEKYKKEISNLYGLT